MRKNDNFMLDFVGIGAPKAATPWVAQCLREHPEIEFSKHKETNYFITDNVDFSRYSVPDLFITSLDEYEKEFEKTDNVINGEFSVYYMFDPSIANTLISMFPDIKILLCLRNPVEFLYSAYNFEKGSNKAKKATQTFAEAVTNANYDELYNKRVCYYAKYLQPYFDTFNREKIHVVIYDFLQESPLQTIQDIYQFLDVDKEFIPPSINSRINASLKMKRPLISYLLGILARFIKRIGYGRYIARTVNSENWLKSTYTKMFKKTYIKDPININFKNQLLKYYEDKNIELENLLGFELPW